MSAEIGRGTKAFDAEPVRGEWRMLTTSDDMLELMDKGADGLVAGAVGDHNQAMKLLAPILDEPTAIVCISGMSRSRAGVVSREYQIPCVTGCAFVARNGPDAGSA